MWSVAATNLWERLPNLALPKFESQHFRVTVRYTYIDTCFFFRSSMHPKSLRWGFLSTARINRALVPPLRASKRNKLAAVASRSLEKARSYAKEWGIPKAYGSYEALLADPDIDVIYNSLPNSLHAEWTVKALYAGKHVLCEKPLALSLEEVDAIITASKATGFHAAEAFMYRHHPQTIAVKEMVDRGAIGKVKLIRGAFTYILNRPGDVRLVPELGGGSIWDVGCYPVSYARYIVGAEPLEVFGWQVTGETGIDDTFVGQMRFPGDVYAQFHSSFRLSHTSLVEITGTEARITIPKPYKPGKRPTIVLDRAGKAEKVRVPGEQLYLGEVEYMADVIQGDARPRIPLDDSRANTVVLLSLLESARKGKPVAIG